MQELTEKYLQAAKERNIQALDDIFTEHAVYIESTGATYPNFSRNIPEAQYNARVA